MPEPSGPNMTHCESRRPESLNLWLSCSFRGCRSRGSGIVLGVPREVEAHLAFGQLLVAKTKPNRGTRCAQQPYGGGCLASRDSSWKASNSTRTSTLWPSKFDRNIGTRTGVHTAGIAVPATTKARVVGSGAHSMQRPNSSCLKQTLHGWSVASTASSSLRSHGRAAERRLDLPIDDNYFSPSLNAT